MAEKELLFSLSMDNGDFRMEAFTSGGKGGQHQNKTASGVRIIHVASGITGESRSERSQLTNKKLAFKRLVEKPEFKQWLRLEIARRSGAMKDIEKEVDELMQPKNIKCEVKENGKWVKASEEFSHD